MWCDKETQISEDFDLSDKLLQGCFSIIIKNQKEKENIKLFNEVIMMSSPIKN